MKQDNTDWHERWDNVYIVHVFKHLCVCVCVCVRSPRVCVVRWHHPADILAGSVPVVGFDLYVVVLATLLHFGKCVF